MPRLKRWLLFIFNKKPVKAGKFITCIQDSPGDKTRMHCDSDSLEISRCSLTTSNSPLYLCAIHWLSAPTAFIKHNNASDMVHLLKTQFCEVGECLFAFLYTSLCVPFDHAGIGTSRLLNPLIKTLSKTPQGVFKLLFKERLTHKIHLSNI